MPVRKPKHIQTIKHRITISQIKLTIIELRKIELSNLQKINHLLKLNKNNLSPENTKITRIWVEKWFKEKSKIKREKFEKELREKEEKMLSEREQECLRFKTKKDSSKLRHRLNKLPNITNHRRSNLSYFQVSSSSNLPIRNGRHLHKLLEKEKKLLQLQNLRHLRLMQTSTYHVSILKNWSEIGFPLNRENNSSKISD